MEKTLIDLISQFYTIDKEIKTYMKEKNLHNGERDAKIREALDEMECFQKDMRENVLHYMNNYINRQEQNNVHLETLFKQIEELGQIVKDNDKRMDNLEVNSAALEWKMFKWGLGGTLTAIGIATALIELGSHINLF